MKLTNKEILTALIHNHFIRRQGWDGKKLSLDIDSMLILHYADTKSTRHYTPNILDLIAKDWEIAE